MTGSPSAWTDPTEFKERAWEWAAEIGVSPHSIRLQKMRTKWGSCSEAGVVTFSSDLLSRHREFGEAVILHELLHLKFPNHGKVFKSFLRSYMPRAESILTTDFDRSAPRG